MVIYSIPLGALEVDRIGRLQITATSLLKTIPSLRSDAAAEEFVATADITQFDLSGFKPMRFEIEPKSAV